MTAVEVGKTQQGAVRAVMLGASTLVGAVALVKGATTAFIMASSAPMQTEIRAMRGARPPAEPAGHTAAAQWSGSMYCLAGALTVFGASAVRRGVRREACGCASLVPSLKAQCIHPDRDDDKICGDCPRNQKVSAAAAFISSVKATCIHPDREEPRLCGDCPRAQKCLIPSPKVAPEVRAAAAFVTSAKATCIHPDREEPRLCGDCPRASKCPMAKEDATVVSAAAAFITSAKATCIHPDREEPRLCGDCPRAGKMSVGMTYASAPAGDDEVQTLSADGAVQAVAAAAFISTAKATCIHPDREAPNLCGDCPRDM